MTTKFEPVPMITADKSTATTFTLAVWVRGSPTPGTSAITADAAGPGIDSAEPAASRVFRYTAKPGMLVTSSAVVRGIAIGGTSVTVQVWFYDDGLAKWVKHGATSTITLATSNLATISAFNVATLVGAKIYVQIVTVNGTVTEFGYDVG